MKTKSTSRTPRTFTRNAILLAITALALAASPTVALAADCHYQTNWTYGIGDWFTSSHWSNGVPDCVTSASIDNGGTAQITHGEATANACSVILGTNSSNSGKLSVDGANANSCTNDTLVGLGGTGSLIISNGGTLTSDLTAQIASLAGSNGSATVDTNSTWTVDGELDVGGTNSVAGGTALLTVTNGGTVSATSSVHVWKSGTLTGNGIVNVNSGSGTATVDGTLAPSGTLTMNGNLSFGANANMRCNVSSTSVDNDQVSGTAMLNGKLSVTVSVTGDFTLLHAGQGRNGTQFSSYSFTYTGCLSASIRYQDNGNGSSDVILHVVSTCN